MRTKQIEVSKRQEAQSDLPKIVAAFDTFAAIKTLSSSIRYLRSKTTNGLVLHVVSTSSGEGATTIAHSLSAASVVNAHLKVLLLDESDEELKRVAWSAGTLSQSLSLARNYDGRPSSLPSLYDDTSAHGGTDHPGKPEEIPDLYRKYREKFDVTIIDCPPIQSDRYLGLMPSAADGIILVVEAEKVRPIVVAHAKHLIEDHGGRVLGVVLNKTKRYIPKFLYKFL